MLGGRHLQCEAKGRKHHWLNLIKRVEGVALDRDIDFSGWGGDVSSITPDRQLKLGQTVAVIQLTN